MRRWYAARAKFNEIERAERNLLQDNFEVFSPRIIDRVIDRGKITERKLPAFAPYLFVAFDRTVAGWEKINYTPGLQGLMMMHCGRPEPEPLPMGVIEELQRLTAEGFYSHEVLIDALLGYLPGDNVEVTAGTYQGHSGKFLEQRGRMIRLMMLALGGVPIPVLLPVESVKWPDRIKDIPKVILSRTSYLRQYTD